MSLVANKKAAMAAVVIIFAVTGAAFLATPATALEPGERLMRTKLRIGGGDILHVTSDVDADDWQLLPLSGGGTRLVPQVADLIYEKGIDVDLADSQMLMYGMDTGQYGDEAFINNSVNTGVKVEETGASGDPTETTAFSIGQDYGYSKVTLNSASNDTSAGYSYTIDYFEDLDKDGVKDDSEYGYLSSFDEHSSIYITMKGDWSNISTAAGDNVVECDLYFTTSGSDLELESHITADADGNTGWSNFDDGSADNKATFLYANADATFCAFYWDLDTLDVYDEDDYSSIKGLDKAVIRNLGWGNSATSELWIYNIVFMKKADTWNYGAYKRPSITSSGALDVDKDFIPSYTAASESDGGMYLNANDDTDYPVTTVTESSSVTSALSNLINTYEQLEDQDTLPLNWRKFKIESDQGETNKEDDKNLALLPDVYTPRKIATSSDGGIIVEEVFEWDFSGMDNIDTSTYLLTWDSTTDKIYVEDYIVYEKMAPDIWITKNPGTLVVKATEGLANTYDAGDGLKAAWQNEVDMAYMQYTLGKQPDTTTGDRLRFVRQVRYHSSVLTAVPEKAGSPLSNQKLLTGGIIAAAVLGVSLTLIALSRRKK